MCGICGIYSEKVDPNLLDRMVSEIEHRGPDDKGVHLDANVGLGFVRLSIIDLSGGHQPMANEDNSIWITFNGEIYNHQEIRESLLKKGDLTTSSN